MIPRCLDSSAAIRQTSIENLQALLYIDQLLRDPSNVAPASELKMFTPLKNNMADANFDKRMQIAGEMANILAAVVRFCARVLWLIIVKRRQSNRLTCRRNRAYRCTAPYLISICHLLFDMHTIHQSLVGGQPTLTHMAPLGRHRLFKSVFTSLGCSSGFCWPDFNVGNNGRVLEFGIF